MKKKIRTAVIGCGAISNNHITAILEENDAELVALCDLEIERAERKRAEFIPTANVYSDYIEMLDKEQPNAVHIATPHHLHCQMACEALKRNIFVFLEKPMCINNEEIAILIEAEKKSKASVCVCFQNRFNPSTRMAKSIIDEHGGAAAAHFSLFWKRDEDYYKQGAWRGKYATEGGGVLINQAIHSLDLLCFILGNPTKVCASCSNKHLNGIIEVEDSADGIILFENGAQANFFATTSAGRGDFSSITFHTDEHRLELNGSALFLDGKLVSCPSESRAGAGKACYGSGHFDLISNFYKSIINGEQMPVTLASAQCALRVLLAAYKSNNQFISI